VEEAFRFSLFLDDDWDDDDWDWDAARRVCMCDEGTGDEAIWYGPNVTCARRDSAMVCRSV
jgi:hypothetical protein